MLIKLINMFFGTAPKTRYRRLIMLILLIGVIVILWLNISYTVDRGFEWRPAASIVIEGSR